MPTLLNIGAPYVGLRGGDKQRARFLIAALQEAYTVIDVYIEETDGPGEGFQQDGDGPLTLSYQTPRWFWSNTVATYSREAISAFRRAIETHQPDLLFMRHAAAAALIPHVLDLVPDSRIVVDLDFLTSRIAQQAWDQNRSIRNRYYLFAYLRNRKFEKWLMTRQCLYLMTNELETKTLEALGREGETGPTMATIPNAMPTVCEIPAPTAVEKRYILFHGVLSSAVNLDAFRYIAREIYPHIREALAAHDGELHIVGRGATAEYSKLIEELGLERVRLVGEVDDMGATIVNADFCIAPLRMGSGTKTRILEVAAYGKAVVTTAIGAEGLNFSEDELVVRDTAEGFGEAVSTMLGDSERTSRLAANLRTASLGSYSEEQLGERLRTTIRTWIDAAPQQEVLAPKD